jgi:hypothetical protein
MIYWRRWVSHGRGDRGFKEVCLLRRCRVIIRVRWGVYPQEVMREKVKVVILI